LSAQTAYALSYSPSSDGFWLVLMALAGVVAGIALFFRGFRMLQYKRLILNTPFSKVRSASLGLVEVNGMPTGPQTISAPLTGESCFYYRVRAWQWAQSESGKGSSWQQVLDESLSVPFYLDDSTAKVLVNPQGADLDVHRSFTDEVQTSRFGKDSLIPQNIQKFAALRGLLGSDKLRLEERIIKPGFPLFVFGTLGENPRETSWTPAPHASSTPVSFGSSLSRSLNFKFNLGSSGSDMAMDMMQQMLAAGPGTKSVRIETRSTTGGPVALPDRIVDQLRHTGIPLPVSVQSESEQMAHDQASLADAATGSAGVSPAHVATATLVAPQSPVTTPASTQGKPAQSLVVPAASTFDLHPRVAINKGQRGDPFTISWQSQREVVQALAWKSMLYIWGSPVFTLACIYFLLVYLGWL
jgi:hypothetical protein